jgi:uncharacterized protein VirK/YbjX
MSTLIQQYLPQDLRDIASTYMISDQFVSTIPDIIEMVLRSSSIEKKEDKQSRFNLLPLMSEDQISRLKDILVKEKTKLAEIEAKYAPKKSSLQWSQAVKREESNYIQKMDVIKKAEAQNTQQEHTEADALLSKL